jgi:hypothetical protein
MRAPDEVLYVPPTKTRAVSQNPVARGTTPSRTSSDKAWSIGGRKMAADIEVKTQ